MVNQSIHPRVIGGRTRHEVSNTRKAASPERRLRTIRSLEAHLVRHPRDGVRASHLAKLGKA